MMKNVYFIHIIPKPLNQNVLPVKKAFIKIHWESVYLLRKLYLTAKLMFINQPKEKQFVELVRIYFIP